MVKILHENIDFIGSHTVQPAVDGSFNRVLTVSRDKVTRLIIIIADEFVPILDNSTERQITVWSCPCGCLIIIYYRNISKRYSLGLYKSYQVPHLSYKDLFAWWSYRFTLQSYSLKVKVTSFKTKVYFFNMLTFLIM